MLDRSLVKVAKGVFDIRKLLKGSIAKLTTEECVTFWSILDILEKKILKERKSALRARLLTLVEELGKPDKKGHKVLKLGSIYAEVKNEVRAGKLAYIAPAALAFIEANKSKDPMVESLIRYEPVVDEAVLLSLREREVMTQGDFDMIVQEGKPTDVLKVKAPREIADLLEDF